MVQQYTPARPLLASFSYYYLLATMLLWIQLPDDFLLFIYLTVIMHNNSGSRPLVFPDREVTSRAYG